jgi:hypothetical protein
MQLFYDSANFNEIPHDATHAALYADGEHAVPRGANIWRIPFRRWITITGDHPRCGIADYEHLNPVYDVPGKLREWAIRRHTIHLSIPIVYCDRANLHSAVSELRGIQRRWWIPTLDNKAWTAQQLHDDILARWEIDIPVGDIWANQYTDHLNQYDESNLFGRWYI